MIFHWMLIQLDVILWRDFDVADASDISSEEMAAFADMQTNFDDDEDVRFDAATLSPNVFLYPEVEKRCMQPPPRRQTVEKKECENNQEGFIKYYSLSLRLVNAFCENVVSHPCAVLRRQCQVHHRAGRYHLLPVTLIPIIIRIQGRQGLGALWKGIGSVFIVRGLVMVSEDILSKITLWPKEVTSRSSAKKICQHLFLKFITIVIVTPFYSASLVETVQSDIASEKPGVLDCVIEGVSRVTSRKHASTCRIMPIWTLALPTAAHGVLRYVTASIVQRLTLSVLKLGRLKDDTKQAAEYGYPELIAGFIGSFVSDVILYPLETIVHRLHIQGTRTIIDNLDTGHEVMPIITKYEGPIDCFQCIVADEGASGLFKGFGALMLQYTLHTAILKLAKLIIDEFDRNYGSCAGRTAR